MKAIFLALLLLIPTSSQVWAQNGPYYASEEEACEANDIENEFLYIIKDTIVYGIAEGKDLAEERRESGSEKSYRFMTNNWQQLTNG